MEFAEGIEKEMWDTGQILSRVQDRPISGNSITFNYIDETSRADGSRRGSVLGYWIDEGTAPTASRPKLMQSEMKLRKIGALGYQTDELLADAPALEAEMREDFLEELTFMTEDAIINGNGVGKPLGIVGHAAVVSVTKETSQAAATIEFNNVNKMWSRVFAHRRRNLVWLINQDCEEQLNQMTLVVGTGGVPVYLPAGGLSVDGFSSLFGQTVIPVEYCAALGTVGDIILVDLSRYRVIRKASGPEFASSMHVAFTTGEMAFRAFYRVDGQPIPRTTIAPKAGNAKSTIAATLATRA
jgi:HK97 family phage major capsid protein